MAIEKKQELWNKINKAKKEMNKTDKLSNLIYLSGVIYRSGREIKRLKWR